MVSFSASERRLGAVLCNAILVALELVSLLISSLENGWAQFRFYTQDSNYFAMLVSAAYLIAAFRSSKRGKPLPAWVVTLRYIATCLLSVTFLVVLLILSPPYGWTGFRYTLFTGAMTFQHLLCPILSFVSFLLFEREPIGRRAPLLALIPTALYAAVLVPLNAARALHGPYPFLYVHEQPWWQSLLYGVVILGGAYLCAYLLWLLRKKAR